MCVKVKIRSITGLAATTINDVKNNIPDVSTLVKKANFITKIYEIEKKSDHDHNHGKSISLIKNWISYWQKVLKQD